MKDPDPDDRYRCVAHSKSEKATDARAAAAVAGRAANGATTPGIAVSLEDADVSTPEGATAVINAGLRELARKNLSPQELTAVTNAAKAALDWHGRAAAAAPKQAQTAESTVAYVDDGAEEAPPPPDFDEVLEIGIEPPEIGVL